MNATTRQGRREVSTTRRGARRGASPSAIEARGPEKKQGRLPTGTRIRCAGCGLSSSWVDALLYPESGLRRDASRLLIPP